MIYYILTLHFLWALYAVFVNVNINEKNDIEVPVWKTILNFVFNFAFAPVAMLIAIVAEFKRQDTLLE